MLYSKNGRFFFRLAKAKVGESRLLLHREILRAHKSEVTHVFNLNNVTDSLAILLPKCLERVSVVKYLRNAFDNICRTVGSGAGPDGMSPKVLEDTERLDVSIAASSHFKNGYYKPGPTRTVLQSRKPRGLSTKKVRKIEIQNLLDKLLDRSTYQVFSPVCEKLFFETSFGSRLKISFEHALAYAKTYTEQRRATWWVTNDVQSAFESVDISRLLGAIDDLLDDEQVTAHLRLLIDRGEDRGILTGSPLSPLLLNIYLHVGMDQPWRLDASAPPLLRYVDDLMVPCVSKEQADECQARIEQLLEAVGMVCKFEPRDAVKDIASQQTEWLGVKVAIKDCTVSYRLTPERLAEIRDGFTVEGRLYKKLELKGILGSLGAVFTPSLEKELLNLLGQWNGLQPVAWQLSKRKAKVIIWKAKQRWKALLVASRE